MEGFPAGWLSLEERLHPSKGRGDAVEHGQIAELEGGDKKAKGDSLFLLLGQARQGSDLRQIVFAGDGLSVKTDLGVEDPKRQITPPRGFRPPGGSRQEIGKSFEGISGNVPNPQAGGASE
jgi:hypothetical protein